MDEQKIINELIKNERIPNPKKQKTLGYFCKKYNVDAWYMLYLYGVGIERKNVNA